MIKLKSYIKEDITVLTYLKEVYLPELRETYIETLTNDNYMKQKVKIGEDQPGELVFHQTRLGFPATLLAVSLYEEALDKYRDFKKVEAS
ncbi:hypothetical protein HY008_01105 [Candidatus Woesebacteria bacterium]|nr:hypothetical protein [Candidatus Woesebacteria bacterium]